ncbi:hypothetical protein QJ366_004168 [Vibrio vulnificus]|nr:hypothetical protein [Vibrio vulnificus]
MGLVVTAVCGSFCIACLRPLTRRYVFLHSLKPICRQIERLLVVYCQYLSDFWW